MQMLDAMMALSRKLGPYVLIELLLPGGTLVAFTLFAVRHPAIIRKYARNARRRLGRAAARARDVVRGSLTRARLTSAIGTARRAFG